MPMISFAPNVLLIILTIALFVLYFKWNKPVSLAMKITVSAVIVVVALVNYLPRFIQ